MAAAVKNLHGIFVPVTSLAFASTHFEDCKAFLAARTASTECVPIVDEAQLIMAADGRLAESGYRFNSLGFSAVANTLSSGLNALVTELSGENAPGIYLSERVTDIAAAINIYNITLRVRFDALRERSLLVNHREQVAEGFLGIDHRFLDNSAFLETVCNELYDKQPTAQFSRAELIGRALRLYFIDPASRRADITPDSRHTFAAGWCFSNREDAGNAIKAAPCLFTRFGVAVAASTTGSRLAHMGADLAGRTAILISRAAERSIDMAVVARQINALRGVSLNFSDDKTTQDAAVKQWANYLGKFRVPRADAQNIVKSAATAGADLEPRDPFEAYSKEALQSRNAYDLFCSILRYAKNQYHVSRDILQATAMELIIPTPKGRKRT